MTQSEINKIFAQALLELGMNSISYAYYDGESMDTESNGLSRHTEIKLEKIINEVEDDRA